MIDNDRIKEIVDRNVQLLLASNGVQPKTDADRQFIADMVELGTGLLQAFNDISYYLSEISRSMDGGRR